MKKRNLRLIRRAALPQPIIFHFLLEYTNFCHEPAPYRGGLFLFTYSNQEQQFNFLNCFIKMDVKSLLYFIINQKKSLIDKCRLSLTLFGNLRPETKTFFDLKVVSSWVACNHLQVRSGIGIVVER